MHNVHAWCPRWSEEGFSPGPIVTDGCESPSVFWKANQVLLDDYKLLSHLSSHLLEGLLYN